MIFLQIQGLGGHPFVHETGSETQKSRYLQEHYERLFRQKAWKH